MNSTHSLSPAKKFNITHDIHAKHMTPTHIKEMTPTHPKGLPQPSWENFVLLNVEIDRLTSACEIIAARNKSLKMRNDQISEVLAENEALHHEIDLLRKNNGRIYEFETQIVDLTNENNRRLLEFNKKSNEVEEWKHKFSKCEYIISTLSSENQSLKTQIGKLRQELEESHCYKDKIEKLNSRIHSLIIERDNLNGFLVERDRMNIELKDKIHFMTDLKKQIQILEHEKESLNICLATKEKTINDLSLKITKLQQEIVELKNSNYKISYLSQENERINCILEEKNGKMLESEKQIQSLNEFKAKLAAITEENQKLKIFIEKEKESTAKSLQEKCHELEIYKNRVNKLEINIHEVSEQNQLLAVNDSLKSNTHEKEKEIHNLMMQICQIEEKLTFATTENKELILEKENLSSIIAQQQKEIEVFKIKASENDFLSAQIRSLETEKEEKSKAVKKDKDEFRQAILERENVIYDLRVKVLDYEQKLSSLLELQQKILALTSENTSLRANLSEKYKEIETLNLKISTLENEVLVVQELREKLSLIISENEKLHVRLNAVPKETEDWKFKISHLSDLETKLSVMIPEKDQLVCLTSENRGDFECYKSRGIKIENQITELSDYKQKEALLYSNLNEKTQEVEKLTSRISQLEFDCGLATNRFAQESEKLNLLVAQKDQELEELKLRLSQVKQNDTDFRFLIIEKESIAEENKRLSALYREKTNEIEELKLKLNQTNSINSEIQNLFLEKKRLAEILVEKEKENETFRNQSLYWASLEKKMNEAQMTQESLKKIIDEKEIIIQELQLRSSKYQEILNASQSNDELSVMAAENKKLRSALIESQNCLNIAQAKLSETYGVGERYQKVSSERDQLKLILAANQREIESLKLKLPKEEGGVGQIGELQNKIIHLNSESKRLNCVMIEKVSELNAIKQQIQGFIDEKKKLEQTISDQLQEIQILKNKIVEIKEKNCSVIELEGEITMHIREKERLNELIDEKDRTIKELEKKYSFLENLYLNVRGNLRKPEALEKKYQDFIQEIGKIEQKLGLAGRSKPFKKSVSNQCLFYTESSPTLGSSLRYAESQKVLMTSTKIGSPSRREYTQ